MSHIQEYADLFKEAGDVLRETGHHSEALRFYEPMKKNIADLNSKFFFDIAICYQALGRKEDVRSSIKFIKDGERTADFQSASPSCTRAKDGWISCGVSAWSSGKWARGSFFGKRDCQRSNQTLALPATTRRFRYRDSDRRVGELDTERNAATFTIKTRWKVTP